MFSNKARLSVVLVIGVALIITALGSVNFSTKAEEEYRMAGVLFGMDQFFRTVQRGMKATAEENNVKLFIGNSEYTIDKERSLLNKYLQMDLDALIISPLSTTASIPSLQKFADKGIPVITYNTTVEGDAPETYIGTRQKKLGTETGKAVVQYIEENRDKLGDTINIALNTCPEYESVMQRVEGFLEVVEEVDGVTIISRQKAEVAAKATEISKQVLQLHPDTDIYWGSNEGGTVGAVNAVRQMDKAEEVKVFGTDMSEQLADFLLSERGILQAVTGQRPYMMGQQAVENAVKVLEGEPVSGRIHTPVAFFSRDNPEEVRDYLETIEERRG